MKKNKYLFIIIIGILAGSTFITSCSTSKALVMEKSGSQLWGENCIRCHNSPSPVDFTDEEWKTIGLHMQIRANLTKDEAQKIIDFLCSAN